MNDITINGTVFRQQFRKCGGTDSQCETCRNGDGHGPYWYASAEYGGLKYVGKELPAEVTEHLKNLKANQQHIRDLIQDADQRAQEHRRAYEAARDESQALHALLNGNHVDGRVLFRLGLESLIFKWEKKPRR